MLTSDASLCNLIQLTFPFFPVDAVELEAVSVTFEAAAFPAFPAFPLLPLLPLLPAGGAGGGDGAVPFASAGGAGGAPGGEAGGGAAVSVALPAAFPFFGERALISDTEMS